MGKRLFVGNLAYSVTEDTLRAIFSESDRQVTDVHIVSDRDTGRPRGFAFVELSSEEEAREAMESLDGVEIEGRALRINEARERQRGNGPGGRERW